MCLLTDRSCEQVEGMGVPRVEIHLGRGYLDTHLHWGGWGGELKEPVAEGKRAEPDAGLENSHPVSQVL